MRRPINAVGNEGQWKQIRIGIDSCAAVSCSPEGTFLWPVEVTPQVREEYNTANAGVIYNQGQQRVEGFIDDYVPFCSKFQVADVNRPLMAVYDIRENDNTVIYSKKYGDWIVNDNTGIATQVYFDQGTSNINA